MSKINLKYPKNKNKTDSISGPEYPSLYLSDVELPVSKKDIGKDVEVTATLKFTGYREDNSTKKNHVSYDFAIKDIEFHNSSALVAQTAKQMAKVFGKKGK